MFRHDSCHHQFNVFFRFPLFYIRLQFEYVNNLKFKNTVTVTFATLQTHFLFNGLFYDQCDGVAMGSPLAPILANLSMGYHEEQWISNYKDSQLLYYRRYVDDTFCLFHNEQDAMKFLNYLNSRHPNIRFTFEIQLNGINSLSWIFWWITHWLPVSLQYTTRVLTLGFLQISLFLLVSSIRLV